MIDRRAWWPSVRRGALPLVLILSTTLCGASPAAAQSFDLCSLFSTDTAAGLLGAPIVDTREYTQADQWRCAQYGDQGEAILDLQRYPSPDEATAVVTSGRTATGGEEIAGLGDTSILTRGNVGHQSAVLWVVDGPWVVVLDVERDLQPEEVAADDLAQVAQRVLDNLPAAAAAQDTAPPIPPAGARRTPADTDPCSVLTDDDMRAALTAVSSTGTAYAARISHTRVPLVEEAPTDAGAASDACKFVWGGNSTLVVLVTREWYDFMATIGGGKPVEGLGGDQAIEVGEVPYVLKGDMAVLAETGGSGGTLRLHREVVKRAAPRV